MVRIHPMPADMGLGAEIFSIPNMINHSFLEAPVRLTIVHTLLSSILPSFLRGVCFVCLGVADQAHSFSTFCVKQFCPFSWFWLHGGKTDFPQCSPFPRSVENIIFSWVHTAFWNLILKPVSLLIFSSFSLSFLANIPLLVLGTKTTVDGCKFPAFWGLFFLLATCFPVDG